MAERKLYFVENDLKPDLTCVYKDSGGTPIDITGYTIKLHINYDTVKTVTATLTDAPNGAFKFTWSAGDLQEGVYTAEIEIFDASDNNLTLQRNSDDDTLLFHIYPEIG